MESPGYESLVLSLKEKEKIRYVRPDNVDVTFHPLSISLQFSFVLFALLLFLEPVL